MGFDFDLQFAITDSKRQSFAIASPLEALFGGEIFAPKVGRASLLLEHLNELTRGKMLADIEEAQRATN